MDLREVNVSTLMPITERPIKVFMAVKAEYHPIRKKLGCGSLWRKFIQHHRLQSEGQQQQQQQKPEEVVVLSLTWTSDYLKKVSQSQFCLSPRGVAGWSPRTFDSILMGCIPVLVADYTAYPFQRTLDWTKFAVFVREAEIPVIGEILSAISPERMTEMHLALKAIGRRTFLYHDHESEMLSRFSLVDLALREFTLQQRVFSYDEVWHNNNTPRYQAVI